jgi:hypothetical protein
MADEEGKTMMILSHTMAKAGTEPRVSLMRMYSPQEKQERKRK